jgi:hypothetical protein
MNIQKMSQWLARWIFLPIVQLIFAVGGGIVLTAKCAFAASALMAHTPVSGIGISPTSMLSGNMPQAALTIHYDKQFFKNLKANLIMLRLCTRREMPMHAGQTYRAFMYNLLGANTTQQTEGTVGTGITLSVNYVNYVMGQWADYVNFSDFSLDTTIDPALENVEREMAYRFAETIQALVRAQFDFLRTLDTKTGTYDATVSPYAFTKAQLEQNVASLLGQNVMPIEARKYHGAIHPFFIGDLEIDNTNNAIIDIMKHTPEGLMRLQELPGVDGEEVDVIDLFGAKWMTTTQVTQQTAWQGSGSTALNTYLAGEDAVVAVKLGRPDKTDMGDGDYRNLKLWRGTYERGSAVDPAGVIGGGTSYNAIMSFGPPPDTTSRARVWAAVPQTT